MTPFLPISADDIAENAIGAWEAGASVLHLHGRNPDDGKRTADPDGFMAFLPRIIATPYEARELFELKGPDRVAF